MILDDILKEKKEEVRRARAELSFEKLKETLEDLPPRRGFKESISKAGGLSLIAEIKRASPSRGLIRQDFDPVEIARIYEENGASALSVLTDERFFKGRLSHLDDVRKAVRLPILRKDFIIDEYQIYESLCAGADAILLIASVLSGDEIAGFLSLASDLNLDCLVEVHTKEELKKALKTDASIIGINNRDLRTLEIDLDTTKRLVGMVPKEKVIVSESGIRSREDIDLLKDSGVDAVLIGEALMESGDIAAKVREIMGRQAS